MKEKVTGNTDGIRSGMLARLESLYDFELEEGVFLSAGCNFGASIHACKNAYCGIGSTIMTGVHTLGEDCLIGAGAVVISDVPDHAVMAGVPAKVLKIKDK